MKDRIRRHFAAHRERYEKDVIELLGRLVAARTVNAGKGRLLDCPGQEVPGEETRVVEILRPEFDALGVPHETYAKHPRRANLVATMGTSGPTLAVGCHSDIVPPGDGWDTDPYVVTRKDGLLFGRGVLDNKGPLASCVAAMRLLRECEVPLAGRFQLAAIASEEFREPDEDDPGIGYLFELGVLKPDFAIIPDIGENMRSIDIAEKGRTVVHVTAIGKQAHGSTPELGKNAVYQMARLVNRIERIAEENELPHDEHPILGHPTVNLGIIRGGAAENIVPGECSVALDIRFVPGQTAEGLVENFRALAAEVGGEWRFDTGATSPPHAMPADHPLVGVLQRNAEQILGWVPEPFGMGGGTFAKSFNLGGIPAVGFGPGDDLMFHVANESIEIRQLVDFAELLACVAIDLLGTT